LVRKLVVFYSCSPSKCLCSLADDSVLGTTQEATITSKKEQNLVDQGKMPGLAEVQKDTHVRPPGEEDAAGNKIHHKGVLGRMLHWQHDSMNADK